MKYIAILVLLLVASCKKEDKPTKTTSIEGKVINSGSKEPVEGVLVTLQDGISSGGGIFETSNVGSGKQLTTYTIKDGSFKISIKGDYPFLSLTKTGYHFNVLVEGALQNVKQYTAGGTYKNEILGLLAIAYFNPTFISKNCIETDSIFFDAGNSIPLAFKKTGFLLFSNRPDKLNQGGKGLYANGDFYYYYWMKYQIKGVWQPDRIDSVYIKSFTTYTDTIYY
jgi:hypothetical protein